MRKYHHSKYIFYILFLVILVVSYNIIKPFLISVISALLLSYIFYPLFQKLNKRLKSENLSSLIVILIIILIIIVPLIFSVVTITKQASTGFIFANNLFEKFNNIQYQDDGSFISGIIVFTQKYKFDTTMQGLVERFGNFIVQQASNILLKIPSFLLNLFIILFMIFYLLKQGPYLVDYILTSISLELSHKTMILKTIKEIIFAVIYGHFLTALVQGFIGAIGFLIFGFTSPFFWGLIMVFAGLIPFVGTAIVWVPAAIIKLLIDISQNDTTGIWFSIGFILYGTLVISGIDNVIKPKLMGSRSKIHPTIILLGVFGGLTSFGVIGILLGPLILSILITFIRIYNKEI